MVDAIAEFLASVGQAGDAALTARPVAGREVVQDLRELVFTQGCSQVSGRAARG